MSSSLKYKNGKVELKLDGQIIPNTFMASPMILEIRGDDLPVIKFELIVNELEIDSLIVKKPSLPKPNKPSYM